MRIKNYSILVIILNLLILIFFLLIIFINNQQRLVNKQTNELVLGIVRSISEINVLINDYIIFSKERAYQQLQGRLDFLGEALSNELLLKNGVFKREVDEIIVGHQLFNDLTSKILKEKNPEVQGFFIGKFLNNSRSALASASTLANKIELENLNLRSRQNKTLVSLMTILLIVNFIMIYFFYFKVAVPIGKIAVIIDEISKGNLNLEIEEDAVALKNEVGDLARAFKRVSASLKLAMRDKNNKG